MVLHARNPCVARVVCHFLVFRLLLGGRCPDFDAKRLHDDEGNDDLYDTSHRTTHHAIGPGNRQRNARSVSRMCDTDVVSLPFFFLGGKYLYPVIADTSIAHCRFRFPGDCPNHDSISILQRIVFVYVIRSASTGFPPRLICPVGVSKHATSKSAMA